MSQIDSYVDGFQDEIDQNIGDTGSTSTGTTLCSLSQLFQTMVFSKTESITDFWHKATLDLQRLV